jgi:tetratricopeptide (TPR) repeat protein
MLGYIRNNQDLKLYTKNKIEIKSNKFVDTLTIKNTKANTEIQEKNSKNNYNRDIDNKKNFKYQWMLSGYIITFLGILSGIVFVDWGNIWQLPKSITFIFGVSGFLVLSSILWIFGFIKHSVKFGLGDIILIIWGVAILILSFLNPNIITFWGSSIRIFDSGLFIGFFILFYLILKLFIESKFIKIISLALSIIILISEMITVILIYIPDILSNLFILDKLQPSNSWLTESPQELVFISLLVFNIIFVLLSKINPKDKLYLLLSFIYYIAVLLHILILIRLPDYAMYILTILSLIINTFIHISKLFQNQNNKNSNKKLIVNRLSFIYGILIIVLVSLIVIRPFQNNSKFPEYDILSVPNFSSSLSITKKSLQTDTLLGVGSVMYAWNRFAPDITETQITDFSFETLYNEIFNVLVRNGIISAMILIIFAIWIVGVIMRMLLIYKKIPIETYILLIIIIGLFLIPFTVITKTLLFLILLMWSNVISQYFKPIIDINLDINKISSSISSLFTFIMIFFIAGSALVSTKFYNIIISQEYIVEAGKVGENSTEQIDLLRQASIKSPYIIEYAHLYIPALIKDINQKSLEVLSKSQQSETQNIDLEDQKKIQDKINEAQALIDQYKQNFPSDVRVVYWQLDLYSIVHTYGKVDENEYLSFINKGKESQPNSLYWDLYESKYYAIQARKDRELNLEKLNQAKSVLNSILEKNVYFVQAYQTYYDLLSLNQDYKEQINILNNYINRTIENNLIANQELVYLLGIAYQNNKQYTEAIAVYNKLLETFPDYTNVYFKLGEIYELEKNTDLSIQNYQKVLELDPNAEPARLKLEQLR